MEQLIVRCAGILGQAEPVVCVRVPDAVTGAPAELGYHLLEDDFTVLPVNAVHFKDVPGAKQT